MSAIIDVIAREILDSRGNPTVECDVLLESGNMGRASVPSGASTGAHEAIELRDGDKARYLGKGVMQAVNNINTEIAQVMIGLEACEQAFLDQTLINLDATENKSRLGANAILAASVATAKASAKEAGLPLYRYLGGVGVMQMPVPMMNLINGGAHANNGLDIQEFMIVPAGIQSFREALRAGVEIFQALKNLLIKRGQSIAVGDEGGFAPNFASHEVCFEILIAAIEAAGYTFGEQIFLAIDCAASQFYIDGKYQLANKSLNSEEWLDYLASLQEQFALISIEDGMAENDWDGWRAMTLKLGDKIQLVGDDIFVTNTNIFKRGIKQQIANSILIKMNQIGTLTETFAAIDMAKCANYTTIISHRSGETEDNILADIAVGMNARQIKTGSLSRSDRLAKYNQLLRIEEDLGDIAKYPGVSIFRNLGQ